MPRRRLLQQSAGALGVAAILRPTAALATGLLALASVVLAPSAVAAPGDLDPSFGAGGIVRTFMAASAEAHAVALQPDGKIAVGGRHRGFAVARYLSNGSLDPSFGSGGIVETVIGDFGERVTALTLGSDGSIVIAGYEPGAFVKVFVLARYLSDGTLDPSFGDGGVVRTPISSTRAEPNALALLPDGRIVAGGLSDVSGPPYDVFTLARYLGDGSLDSSFRVRAGSF